MSQAINSIITVKEESDVDSLDIETIAEDPNASIVIKGNEKLKNNSVIQIKVKAENGNECIYSIKVKKPSNALKYIIIIVVLIGAIIGGASDEQIDIAQNYAVNLGLAFQIIDDILDIIGDQNLLGKPIGSDAENGKTTFVSLLGLENAKELALELTNEAVGLLSKFNGDTKNLELLTKYLLDRKF